MVYRICSVYNCKSTSRLNDDVKFHRFPRDDRRDSWIDSCRRPNLREKSIDRLYNMYVCSLHFEDWMYMKTKLKSAAIPTLNLPPASIHSIGTQTEVPEDAGVEEIVTKDKVSKEDRNQCRLCLSVGRKMQALGALYTPLYGILLFGKDYERITNPSCMYEEVLACWECYAELRSVARFQEKVRHADAAFKAGQNHSFGSLSNLSAILIDEIGSPNAEKIEKLHSIKECTPNIKKEVCEIEVEETVPPDPLEVNQELVTLKREAGVTVEIQRDSNISVQTQNVSKDYIIKPITTQKAVKRAMTETQDVPKRVKIEQNVAGKSQIEAEASLEGTNPKSIEAVNSSTIFSKVKVELDELQRILEDRRNKESFKSMEYKCDSCILGFTNDNRLQEHKTNVHNENVGSCICIICASRFVDNSQLSAHYSTHFVKFVCRLCDFECYTKTGRMFHVKRHKDAVRMMHIQNGDKK